MKRFYIAPLLATTLHALLTLPPAGSAGASALSMSVHGALFSGGGIPTSPQDLPHVGALGQPVAGRGTSAAGYALDAGLLSAPPGGSADTDGDGTPNSTDQDDDNDGVPDIFDPLPLDTDNDGINNDLDPDDDADGIPDDVDPFPLDTDNDGVSNFFDDDDDGDFISDDDEGGIFADTDGDGVPNALDTDSDNDGLGDHLEQNFGSDPYSAGDVATVPLRSWPLLSVLLAAFGAALLRFPRFHPNRSANR